MREKLYFYICDDNHNFAATIKKEISLYLDSKRDYDAVIFNSGTELLKQFDKQIADVVLLDIDMPEMNGFEVASLLQKRKEDVLILFVTMIKCISRMTITLFGLYEKVIYTI